MPTIKHKKTGKKRVLKRAPKRKSTIRKRNQWIT